MQRSHATTLLELAEQVSRLPAYNHRNPHAFHEGKSEVVAKIRAIARELGPVGRAAIGPCGQPAR